MPQYNPPIRDMQFLLHEVLDAVPTLQALPPHAGIDADTLTQRRQIQADVALALQLPLHRIDANPAPTDLRLRPANLVSGRRFDRHGFGAEAPQINQRRDRLAVAQGQVERFTETVRTAHK